MREAAKSVRPSKRDVIVIDDDDSASEQPVEKIVKREEEPVSSPAEVDLQKKLCKSEENFQRACRAARTAELRAEAAEARLDSKYGIKDDFNAHKKRADELELRLLAVTSQLEGTRRSAETVISERTKLAQENEALKKEMVELKRSTGTNRFIQTSLGSLINSKHRDSVNSDLQEKVNCLTDQLSEEQRRASEERTRDRERLDSLTNQLAEEQRRASEDRTRDGARIEEQEHKLSEFARENEALNKQVDSLTNHLDEEKRRASEDRSIGRARIEELEKKFSELTLENEALNKKVNSLTNHLAEEQRRASEERTRHRTRIDDLTQKLGQYEEIKHQLHQAGPSRQRGMPPSLLQLQLQAPQLLHPTAMHPDDEATDTVVSLSDQDLTLHITGHPTNIFQLCRPDSIESISIECARDKLLSVIAKLEGNSFHLKMDRRFANLPELKMNQHCEACDISAERYTPIIEHFLSTRHYDEVKALGATVSSAAVEYWLDKIKPVSHVQPMQQHLFAAAAGVVARSGVLPMQHYMLTAAVVARQMQRMVAAAAAAPSKVVAAPPEVIVLDD